MLQPFSLVCKVLTDGARPFRRARLGDAGYDVWAAHVKDGDPSGIIAPGQATVFGTGIATAFPDGWVGLVLDRGGQGFKGLMRQAGVVDSNYRGEWFVRILNTSNRDLQITLRYADEHKAMCQVVFVPCGYAEPEIVEELPESVRGASGFGSSDAK